uniref:Chorein N-terminal domain-containing protein n=1 Tax=Peronospora matthiolae TaxID=2874970 RepID=A0AAV1U3G5_9STRA
MLDLLSPLRGYIAQSLQFYLSKYIEDIQLERLGLFGGDLVLNDLKIKRHVLRESLDIPSSFDFSRGFIRELRIHIPWTQLLSHPIEVKLYTIELILTAKNEQPEQRAARGSTVSTAGAAAVGKKEQEEEEEEERSKMEHPKSGWIHDTLQTILSNISVQVNNLVLKYEHDDIVFSIALGTLDFYSASESSGWKRCFDQLKGEKRVIRKSVDAKDVTIFLDRYMSTKHSTAGDPVRRNVIGYEVPVLSRTSASVRAKLQLFSTIASGGQNDRSNSPIFQGPLCTNNEVRRIIMSLKAACLMKADCVHIDRLSCATRSTLTRAVAHA